MCLQICLDLTPFARALAALALTTGFGSCVSDPPKPFTDAPLPDVSTELDWDQFALGPGDVLLVRVLGHPELSTHSDGEAVSSGGTLSLPMIGEVNAQSLTPEEFEREIERRLAEYLRTPDATVSVRRYNARKFYVVGELVNPGAYTMERPLNVLQAIAEAGQFIRGANREEIILMRGTGPELKVAYFNAETPGPMAFSAIQPDDILLVQRKGSSLFESRVLPIIQGATSISNAASYLGLMAHALRN